MLAASRRPIRFIGLLVIVLVFTICVPLPVAGAPNSVPPPVVASDSQPSGADVVFLVDQSGSMATSDPLGLRFQGVEYALDWMGETILDYDTTGTHSFRTAVVDFGTDAVPVLNPFEIHPASDEAWNNESKYLQDQLAPGHRHSLGSTDFEMAFAKARDMFSLMPIAQSDTRTRVIILLSDGEPYPAPPDAMRNLSNYVKGTFPYPEYQIYVVALSSPDSVPWAQYQSDWNQITHGNFHPVANRRTLGSDLQSVLGQIAASLGLQGDQKIGCGTVPISPYLDLARITIHKPDPTLPVRIWDPSGHLVSDGTSGKLQTLGTEQIQTQGQQTPIESATIYNPQPGMWRLECPATGETSPVVFLRQVAAKSQVVLPGSRLALGVPYKVTFRLVDHWGNPLVNYADPRYALDVRLVAQSQDATEGQAKKPEELSLHFDNAAHAYVADYVPSVPGNSVLKLTARSTSPDGSEWNVADTPTRAVQVMKPVAQVSIDQQRPTQLSPLTLSLLLTDQSGIPFSQTSDLLSSLDPEVIVTEGSETQTVHMSQTATGMFQGSYTAFLSGSHPVLARVLLRNPSAPNPIVIAENSAGSLQVRPIDLPARINEQTLTQLVPASLQITSSTNDSELLKFLETSKLWQVELSGLGSERIDIDGSSLSKETDGVSLSFIPKSTGVFTPEMVLALRRNDTSPEEAVVRKRMPAISVASPSINPVYGTQSNLSKQRVVGLRVLDATGRPYADVIDHAYSLVVRAEPASAEGGSAIDLKYHTDGTYSFATQPVSGMDYYIDVFAQKTGASGSGVLVAKQKLVNPSGVSSHSSTITQIGTVTSFLAGSWPFGSNGNNLREIAYLLLGLAVLIVVIVLGLLWWLRQQKNTDAVGYILLQKPKGTVVASFNWGESRRSRDKWWPDETVTVNGQPTKQPVTLVSISQSTNDVFGGSPAGDPPLRGYPRVGVEVFYKSSLSGSAVEFAPLGFGFPVTLLSSKLFSAFGGKRWLSDGDTEALKDGFFIGYSVQLPERPEPTVNAQAETVERQQDAEKSGNDNHEASTNGSGSGQTETANAPISAGSASAREAKPVDAPNLPGPAVPGAESDPASTVVVDVAASERPSSQETASLSNGPEGGNKVEASKPSLPVLSKAKGKRKYVPSNVDPHEVLERADETDQPSERADQNEEKQI